MICSACNQENREGRKFCAACGNPLTLLCGSCGSANEHGEAFCGECGAPLATPAANNTPQASTNASISGRSPLAYTPKHLADKILQTKSALEGERKQVTVMFADVKGSMELAEQLDPEEWHNILDRFFAILTEGVHRFEGTVNQYTGDGIMALFGAPIAHEDHAQRACYAALQLRDQLQVFSEEVRRTHGVDFSTRIGLNSGEVIVGKIGDDLRMDYTAQGHTVGLAQRMEALAQPDKPYLTGATANLVQGYFELDDLGEFNVKGSADPMRVFALLDTGAARTRVDSANAKDLSKFVGREDELATLIHAYEESDAGRGQVIGVVAGPGVGKSRLVKEFLDHVQEAGGWISLSNCPSHGQDVSLLNYMEAVRSMYGIESRDASEAIHAKVRASFLEQFGELNEGYALMCDLVGAPDPEHPVPPVSPEERQRRYMQWELLAYEGRKNVACYVAVIEDLHWIDSGSLPILDETIRWTPNHRQMLLLTQRPDYTPPWVTRSFYRQIPLLPLGHYAVDELTTSLLGPNVAESGLNRLIRDRCGGTPFFIEESIQSLSETGFLEGERGNYSLVKPVDEIPLPATVQAVLAARIDRLGEGEKRLLQTASIIGRLFPLQVLKAISEESETVIDAALQSLLDAELIYEHAIHPDVEYIFKHALTQDVAYASQLSERRESIHALVAKAFETRYANQLDEKAALIAQHWEKAGRALDAVRWHHRAAHWVGRFDLVAATRHWRSVRALRREVPDQKEIAAFGIDACRRLLQNMCFRVDVELGEASALLEEGLALADAIGDHRSSLYMSMIYSRVVCGDGDVPTGIELSSQNLQASLQYDEAVVQSNAAQVLIDALWVAGELAESLDRVKTEMARVPRHVPREEWLWGFEHYSLIRVWRFSIVIWMGDLQEAIEGLRNTIGLAEEDGTLELAAYAYHYAAEAHYFAGDADGARACAHDIESISNDRPEHLGLVAHTHLAFGYAHLAAGRPTEAVKSMRNALDLLRRVDKAYAGKAACFLAIALLEEGDLAAAETTAHEAIALCRRSLRDVYEAMTHCVVALVLLRRDGEKARDAVETEFTEAAKLIEQTGAISLSPALLEGRAELAEVLGDESARVQLLREAVKEYKDIGAPKHVERLSKELDS